MATNILMPALSPTMTEGTLARWLKKEGDAVRSGDVIAEIETDKATMEVEAVDEGVLGKILVADGTAGVQVNAPIAVLVEAGEAVPSSAPSPAPPPSPTPAAAPEPKQAAPAAPTVAAPASPTPSAPAPVANGHAPGERIFASPLARRMAKQAGIDLSAVQGSGPNGRIIRVDIEAAHKGASPGAAAQEPVAASPPAAAPAPKQSAITAPHRLAPHTGMRRTIARRMTEAKQAIPHYYASIDVELDALLKLRADLNAKSPKDGPGAFKLSVNDLVVKAVAVTLRRLPHVNSAWTDDGIVLFDDIDIAIAVSIPEGLITPILRQADRKGLAVISNEMKDLGARAKSGKLKPEEFQGGSFSISNMGMYGVTTFAAIINPPQAAILAVAAGLQRAVVREGQLAVATVMTVTLAVDHRVLDGAQGAQWLAEFKRVAEDPLSLML